MFSFGRTAARAAAPAFVGLFVFLQIGLSGGSTPPPRTSGAGPAPAKPEISLSVEPIATVADDTPSERLIAKAAKPRARKSAAKTKPAGAAPAAATAANTGSAAILTDADEGKDGEPSAPPAAAPAAAPVALTTETLPGALETAISGMSRASRWGVDVAVAQTGQILFEHAPQDKFIPASNRKVFTAALAFDQLAPDFKFRSYFYRTGPIRPDGTVDGNLVVLPSGDPTFSNRLVGKGAATDWIFRDWVQKASAAGIKRCTGDLIIDCSDWDLNDLMPRGWANRIRSDYYAVTPSPLAINENLMGVKVRPGVAGAPPIVEYFPPAAGYPVSNIAVSGGKGFATIKRLTSGPIQVSGNVGKASEAALPCDNPALFAAAVLRHRLSEAGITLGGTARLIVRRGGMPSPTADNLIAVYESPTLTELVSHMMKHSNNHFAEQIYVSISAHKSHRGGYTESRRLEAELLRKSGIDPRGIRSEDGSGLSELNRVSPRQMVQLLAYMTRHPAGQQFFDAMAVSGVDGTLRGRMSGNLRGRVHGKTGFINGVTCLSGYLVLSDTHMLVFSFLVNDVRGGVGGPKSVQDRLCDLLSRLVI